MPAGTDLSRSARAPRSRRAAGEGWGRRAARVVAASGMGVDQPGSSLDAADTEVLELGVVEDSVFRALAAHAGLLDPAERGDLRRDDPGVEPDDAVFERLRHAPRAREVARVEIRGKAELGVVRHADRVLLVLEAEDRCHRTKGLLARDEHVGLYLRDHRRLEERAAQRVTLAAIGHLAALGERIGDVLFDLGYRARIDQGALVGRALESVAHAELAHGLDELRDESLVHAVLHQDPVRADTGLAGVAILARDRTSDRGVEIGVGEHDEGRVAAQL